MILLLMLLVSQSQASIIICDGDEYSRIARQLREIRQLEVEPLRHLERTDSIPLLVDSIKARAEVCNST